MAHRSPPKTPPWVSRIKLPENWSEISPLESGYCYLTVFTDEITQKAAYTLGPYPTWGEVNSFGSFSRGNFHVRRRRGKVHIGTSGAGVPAHKLDIRSDEVVGVVDSELEILKWSMWFVALYMSPLLTPFVFLCWNHTTLVEVSNNRHFLSSKRPRSVSTVGKWPMLLMLLVANFKLSSAALTFRFENVVDSLEVRPITAERRLLAGVHHRYTRSRKRDKIETICLENNDLMVEVLDLDVRDEVLDGYISKICPGMADGWRDAVEEKIISEGLVNYVEYFQVAREAVDETVDRVAEMSLNVLDESVEVVKVVAEDLATAAKEVKDVADKVLEDVLTDLPKDLDKLGDVAVGILDETLTAAVRLASTVLDEMPVVEKEVGDVVEEAIKLIPKPSDLISDLIELTPTTDQVLGVVAEGIGVLSTATTDVFSATYDQAKDVVTDNFQSLGEKDFVEMVNDTWTGWLRFKDNTLNAVIPGAKMVVDGMPSVSYNVANTAGSFFGGLLEGSGLSGEMRDTLMWKISETLFGERETKEEKKNRLDHEAYMRKYGRRKFKLPLLTRPNDAVRDLSTYGGCLVIFVFTCFFIWDCTSRSRI